jgi:hypothetical protein
MLSIISSDCQKSLVKYSPLYSSYIPENTGAQVPSDYVDYAMEKESIDDGY